MPELTQFNTTQALRGTATPPPTQDPGEALFTVLFYLFSLMCADNNICSGVFRILCSLAVWIGGAALACVPVSRVARAHNYDFRFDGELLLNRETDLKCATIFMFLVWASSNIAGYYAFKSTYDHELRFMPYVDDVDRFDVVTDSLFSYAAASMFYTGFGALLFSGGRACINSGGCRRNQADDHGYSALGEAPRVKCC